MTGEQLAQLLVWILQAGAAAAIGAFVMALRNRNTREKLQLDAQKIIYEKFQERDAQYIALQQQVTTIEKDHAFERGKMTQVIEANTAEMKGLRERLTQLEKDVLLLSSERDGLQKKLKETEEKLASLVTEMQTKIDEAVKTIKDQYAVQIADLNGIIDTLKAQLKTTEDQLASKNVELKTAQDALTPDSKSEKKPDESDKT